MVLLGWFGESVVLAWWINVSRLDQVMLIYSSGEMDLSRLVVGAVVSGWWWSWRC